VPEESIWTSASATSRCLETQRPGGTAFVVGESGLSTSLYPSGYTLTDRDPDYVVLGETRTYSFERITQAIRLIAGGARFIATNPDPTDHPRHRRRALLRRQARGRPPHILVLSGVTTAEEVERFPYRPSRIVDSVADLIDDL
jgi:NagD protein